MKLACSSTAFDQRFASGDLTQLEWIDLCAHEIAADGVVFDVRHFPRFDTDYLAQVKKMATDVGLTVTAVSHDGFFGGDGARMEQSLEIALALGAPLLAAPLPRETSLSWSEVQALLGRGNLTCQAAQYHDCTAKCTAHICREYARHETGFEGSRLGLAAVWAGF